MWASVTGTIVAEGCGARMALGREESGGRMLCARGAGCGAGGGGGGAGVAPRGCCECDGGAAYLGGGCGCGCCGCCLLKKERIEG